MTRKATDQDGAAPLRFRDRITELRRVRGSDLLDNAKNWRRHPEEQRGAMTSMLDKLGFTGAVIGRDTPEGVQLLDGHLRKSIAADQEVPVLIVDLNDEEADMMLATFDPLAELAVMDADQLRELLEQIDTDDDAFMRKLMSDVSEEAAEEAKESGDDKRDVEGMALEPHEHYDYLVVMAQTSHEWNVLCDRLQLTPEPGRRGRIGTARAIRASRLIDKLLPK